MKDAEPHDAQRRSPAASELRREVQGDAALDHASDEPPVVARLVVEIRSDGTRTVARGAIEDRLHGERAALEIKASTPLELARSLVGTLLKMPLLKRTAGKPLPWGRRKRQV